jgi:hypothetical protein
MDATTHHIDVVFAQYKHMLGNGTLKNLHQFRPAVIHHTTLPFHPHALHRSTPPTESAAAPDDVQRSTQRTLLSRVQPRTAEHSNRDSVVFMQCRGAFFQFSRPLSGRFGWPRVGGLESRPPVMLSLADGFKNQSHPDTSLPVRDSAHTLALVTSHCTVNFWLVTVENGNCSVSSLQIAEFGLRFQCCIGIQIQISTPASRISRPLTLIQIAVAAAAP